MKVEILNIAEINTETKEQQFQFNKFKKEEEAVYTLICPQRRTYTAKQVLDLVDIPERIKELVELTKERFYKFEIWEAESAEQKDPIILGREQVKDDDGKVRDSWYDLIYYLGRWGEELENFQVLKKKAIDEMVTPVKIELMKAKAKIDFYLKDVPLFMKDAVKNGRIELPRFDEGCLSKF